MQNHKRGKGEGGEKEKLINLSHYPNPGPPIRQQIDHYPDQIGSMPLLTGIWLLAACTMHVGCTL